MDNVLHSLKMALGWVRVPRVAHSMLAAVPGVLYATLAFMCSFAAVFATGVYLYRLLKRLAPSDVDSVHFALGMINIGLILVGIFLAYPWPMIWVCSIKLAAAAMTFCVMLTIKQMRKIDIQHQWSRARNRLPKIVWPTEPGDLLNAGRCQKLWTTITSKFILRNLVMNGEEPFKLRVKGFVWNKLEQAFAEGHQLLQGETSRGIAEALASENVCAICWDHFASEDKVAVLHCNHYFHATCSRDWFKRSLTCPKCRQVFEWHLAAATA